MAINHPIQGAAADVIKVGMINLQKRMDEARLGARMLLQVHDELIFESPPEEMETEAQMMETRVFNYVCGAKWFSLNYYEELLNDTGFRLLEKENLYTGKKLTPRQAGQEIEYACTYVPEVYGVRTRTFDDVWSKFGPGIERHELEHYSKAVYLKAIKTCVFHHPNCRTDLKYLVLTTGNPI